MRWISLSFLLLTFSCQSFDTDTNLETEFVPGSKPVDLELEDHIDIALEKMYPKMGKYKILIKQKTAVVNFIMGGNIYEVKFNLDGEWMSSKVEIAYEFTLPDKVQDYLKQPEFTGWILSEKKLIQSPAEIEYKFVWKKGKEIQSVWLDHNGELIKGKTDKQELVKP